MSLGRVYQTVKYPHEICDFIRSGDSVNVLATASQLVKEVLCSAKEYISNDIAEVFYYKLPLNYKTKDGETLKSPKKGNSKQFLLDSFTTPPPNVNEKQYFDYNDDMSWITHSLVTEVHKEESRHPDDIEWSTIERFNIRDVASQIRDYIELWRLMAGTKCALKIKEEMTTLKNKGFRHYVDAYFSNPTAKCPNPLAVAKVNFFIHLPELMPKYYPVMVTYRFEGFKSQYYALGHRQMRSLEFQRFFIDTILHMKLSFYAELFECRFAAEGLQSESVDEEEIIADAENECEHDMETEFEMAEYETPHDESISVNRIKLH